MRSARTPGLRSLGRDEDGSTIVEFALLAPVLIGFLIGIFQVGISMQAYNAMRSVTSDTARYAVVEYQKKNEVTNAALETYAETLGTGTRYNLRSNFDASISNATNQRVSGAIEKTMTVTYTPPSVLPMLHFTSYQMSFSRPIFVIDE